MIRSRPFGNAAGSAARIAPSRRSEQLALVLLEIELSQETHQKRDNKKRSRRQEMSPKIQEIGPQRFRHALANSWEDRASFCEQVMTYRDRTGRLGI
jgi:CelD/BcsL family acetyltransferase involved in cellulose biosynthesis